MHKSWTILSIILVIVLPSCSISSVTSVPSSNTARTTTPTTQRSSTVERISPSSLTIFAAASLTGAFQELAANFEASHPGVSLHLNFAGSQILRTQIAHGAAADIFASADQTNMDQLAADGQVISETIVQFATNQLVIILPRDNPGNVSTLTDLARPDLKLVLADATVPAGRYARQMLQNLATGPSYGTDFSAKVLANVVSNETDVKQVVAKIELGEADAGIVYTSDAVAAPELGTIPIPAPFNVIAMYPIAILTDSRNQSLAETFIMFVISEAGQSVLKKWGFTGAGQ
jgi:molybdate transport system substrate-binding protein